MTRSSAAPPARSATGRPVLRFFSGLSIRLLAFNLLLVFLPAFGVLLLGTYEQQLLVSQERAMVQQARILAAALAESGPIERESAQRILVNLAQRQDARLRVIGPEFDLLADSSSFGPRIDEPPTAAEPDPGVRDNLLYRLGNLLYGVYARAFLPPEPPTRTPGLFATESKLVLQEVEEALQGGYGANMRRSPGGQRSLTMYSALPIRSDGEVVGAVLVSKSTYQILGALYELRLAVFQVILLSVTAAVVLSLLLSTTIARPISKLRQQAQAILDRRGRLTGRFKVYRRQDEIGDLSRALAELTRRLEGHLSFIESFASDVSHELKNPLASIRTAAELLAEVEEPHQRARFRGMIQRDIARLERLLSGVREVSQIDARLEQQPVEAVDLEPLLRSLAEAYGLRPNGVAYRLQVPQRAVTVVASPDRLIQVLENLLDNATGFSPEGGEVELSLVVEGADAVVRVRDRGPGIPVEHLEKIFHRFFSYRESRRDGHTGLGLSIVKAIVEGYGGSVQARNRDGGGAELGVRLPLVD
ncbi:MAG: ATP-binding protein [Acidobacteriota bacterium]